MIEKVGYACINESMKPRSFKSYRLKSLEDHGLDYMRQRVIHNMKLLADILEWNVAHGIHMYRVSSDLIPLATHPEVRRLFDWRWDADPELLGLLEDIRGYRELHGIRLSMHPDQYTVLNSIRKEVVRDSIAYLEYHGRLLTRMGGGDIIIHAGGVYGDKPAAMARFAENIGYLSQEVRNAICLENDDTSYSLCDVLELSEKTGIPVVFDYHHHRCLSNTAVTKVLLDRIVGTWGGRIPKVHISSGRSHDRDKRHHDYISPEDCAALVELFWNVQVDVMVEAKKKEQAALMAMASIKRIQEGVL